MQRTFFALSTLGLLAVGTAGCPQPVNQPPPGGPTVSLQIPSTTLIPGEVAAGTVAVTNFTLQPPGGSNATGVGHYHIYLDSTTPAGSYIVVDSSTTPNITIPPTTPAGAHTLIISLRNNDHTELSPPVQSTVGITVVSPTVTLTAPRTVQAGTAFAGTVAATNFTLQAAGGAAVVGEGHWRIFLDNSGTPFIAEDFSTAPSNITVPAATSVGQHMLIITLVNNDNTDLTPPVSSMTNVWVVEPGAAGVSITSPVTAAGAVGDTITLSIATSAFHLVAPAGSPAPFEGHYHVYLMETPTVYVPDFNPTHDYVIPAGTAPGMYHIVVELRNNDHSALATPVSDQIILTVM